MQLLAGGIGLGALVFLVIAVSHIVKGRIGMAVLFFVFALVLGGSAATVATYA